MTFKGKVVAVTGGVGGIGQALCRYFGGEGASIAALDKNPEVEAFAQTLCSEGIPAIAETVDIGRISRGAPQQGPHARPKFQRAERLSDIVANPGCEAGPSAGLIRLGRLHQHGEALRIRHQAVP